MRKNSIKNTRINGEVQRELSQLINREIKDPRINPMTTVVAVDVTPDLKHAKIYISVLGDEESKKNTLAGLRSAAPYMRGQLARSINLRNTPELSFVIDQSIEYGINMSKLIDEVNKDKIETYDHSNEPDSYHEVEEDDDEEDEFEEEEE
jgi:ribosome-binding factor A